jgi:membrane protein
MWRLPSWLEFKLIRAFEHKFRIFTLPGLDGIPFYDVMTFFINELKDRTLVTRAQAIAYSFFLAVFPFILFAFTLIPYLPIPDLRNDLIQLIKELAPNEHSLDYLKDTIIDVIKNPRFGLLSIGFLSAIYLSTNGVITMMRSFDKSYDIYIRRSFLKEQIIALKLTFLLFLLFASSLIIIIIGGIISNWLTSKFWYLDDVSTFIITFIRYSVIILLFLYSISLIYYEGPAVTKKWKFITPGSWIATILSIIISIGFSYYVKNFGNYNKIYGSLGTIIILQIWFYLNSLVLLIGFEINASIYYNKSLKSTEHNDL